MTIKPCCKRGLTATNLITGRLIASVLITSVLTINTFVFNAAQAETAVSTQSYSSLKLTRSGVILKRWLNKSVDNHPSVLAAQAAVDSAKYRLIAADKAIYNPELEIDAETAETDSAFIGLSQTIDWGDTRGARTEMAGSLRSAARSGFEAKRREIADELLVSLSKYHTSTALKKLAIQGEKLMQQSAQLAKQRFDAGDLSKVEVDLSNLTYAQARFKLADAISQQARARQKLIALTGSVQNNLPEMLTVFPDPQETLLQQPQYIDNTVQQLPQMREIRLRVKSAMANVKVQSGQSSANPTIAFRAGKEEQDTLLGLTLSIPLQVRNNFQAEVDSANAELIQAERESMNAYRKLKSRLEIAIVSYDLSREAWLAWQQSGADTLSQQIKLLETLWKAGELNTTNYLIQLTQALETKASAIEQRGRMWADWSEWLIALGKIEQWLNYAPAINTREQS